MRVSFALFSPKQMLNSHPRNAVRFRHKEGFYLPKYGASKMKWKYTLPYRREIDSLFHYPEVSRVTGKTIDWYHQEPEDGYEGARTYGEHTLELTGMPLGRTPEYMQERLRRFFSKFGPVMQCRANPHRFDPYQCEGTAYVTFRDRDTALKALKAPLKFPASLHDKVIRMRHLDSDKRNDPDYLENSKFWNAQLVILARQLHIQLCSDPKLRADGKPLFSIGLGILEHTLVKIPKPRPPPTHAGRQGVTPLVPQGRGGVPVSKGGLQANPTTRLAASGAAVKQRFGTWAAFLAEPPLDELFIISRREVPTSVGGTNADSSSQAAGEAEETLAAKLGRPSTTAYAKAGTIVVKPRLVSAMQRSRLLARAKLMLQKRLHAEFSQWWREGKIDLPEYTQSRMTWWDHSPPLAFQLQIQSRSRDQYKIFDEKFLYKHQLVKARQERRKERRSEWNEERKRMLAEKQQKLEERRGQALEAIADRDGCGQLLGRGLSPQTGM